mmetsp:Transcript_14196/g.18124  ORF Transcript_14196/g.18124 Transcript_14196/m.18124 type:complete len:532 (-) Transcript_14196:80-1675(-)
MKNPRENLDRDVSKVLQKRKVTGAFRSLLTTKTLVDFSSNDYLGLARSENLHQKIVNEVDHLRKTLVRPSERLIGSTGSRLLAGNSQYYEDTEKDIAEFHSREAALIFNSGYDANLGIYSSLPNSEDAVLYDELMHNSVRMGILLGRQRVTQSFRHNDVSHLQQCLEACVKQGVHRIYVAVESVYSMDGDFAPLKAFCDLCLEYGACVVVDEAHGTGVFGTHGQGLLQHLQLEQHPALIASVHTYGKALGVHGATVLCSCAVKDYLINYARPLIYSTSLPLHSLASIRCAYRFQASEEGYTRRSKVLGLVDLFKRSLTDQSATDVNLSQTPALDSTQMIPSDSPIQAVLIPGNQEVIRVSQCLMEFGFDVKPIRAPTVPEGTERLRVILHAHNHESEVIQLAAHLRKLMHQSKDPISEDNNSDLNVQSHNSQKHLGHTNKPPLGMVNCKDENHSMEKLSEISYTTKQDNCVQLPYSCSWHSDEDEKHFVRRCNDCKSVLRKGGNTISNKGNVDFSSSDRRREKIFFVTSKL